MENAAASEQPAPEPALTDAEVIMLEHEGQQSSPSLSQAQKMRELDKDGKLNGDVIDGILSQEKKEVCLLLFLSFLSHYLLNMPRAISLCG